MKYTRECWAEKSSVQASLTSPTAVRINVLNIPINSFENIPGTRWNLNELIEGPHVHGKPNQASKLNIPRDSVIASTHDVYSRQREAFRLSRECARLEQVILDLIGEMRIECRARIDEQTAADRVQTAVFERLGWTQYNVAQR